MASPSSELPDLQPLAGQLVVFTGKLSSLGRRDARALVARLGGVAANDVNLKTTMLVVGAEGFGPNLAGGKSHKVQRAEELNSLQAARISIVSEEEFCGLAGVPTADALKRQYYALRDLAGRYRSLREDQLRYMVKCGIVQPVFHTNAETFFAFPALGVLKQANDEVEQGASFRAVVRAFLASHRGQLAFDFRLDAAPARVLALRRPTATDQPGPEAKPRVAAHNTGSRRVLEKCGFVVIGEGVVPPETTGGDPIHEYLLSLDA